MSLINDQRYASSKAKSDSLSQQKVLNAGREKDTIEAHF